MGCFRAVVSRFASITLLVPMLAAAACSSEATPAPPADEESHVGEVAQAVVSSLTLFATGVNASNVVLANGAVDPHYSITATTDPARPAPPPRSAFASTTNAGWVSPGATSKWISLDGTQCTTCVNATYDYTTTFAMPAGANPLTATITFILAADDDLTLRLNGTQVYTANGIYGADQTVTIGPNSAAFTSGTNTLVFHVNNSGGGPTGLDVRTVSGTASECTADSHCTASQFCDTSAQSCVAKLANGTSIPTIGGHTPPLNGTCSAAVGTSVCTSAVCDTADNKCGYANGDGACTAGNAATVCRSGVCGSDSKCGLVIGDGTCTTGNAATVCRSGACGSASGKCVPAGGSGCEIDGDCAANQFCNGSTLTCTAKLANGTTLLNDPLHNSGTCTAGVGTAECASGVCDTADNKCGYANGDGTCNAGNAGTVCRSGACGSDSKCGLLVGDATCTTGNAATVCRSGACGSASGKCVPAGGSGCEIDGDCAANQFCFGSTLTCTAKLTNGAALLNDPLHNLGLCNGSVGAAECASGVCDTDNACGLATGDGTCNTGNAGVVCRSGACGSSSGKCVPAGGSGCAADGDCASNQFCNGSTLTCTAKLGNGTALVSDPLHSGGVCTGAVGAAECVSGVCDADNACGFANGDGTCNSGNGGTVCRSGACGSDSKCGLIVGDGTCTTGNAATVCRSGACGAASGKCVPAGGSGCEADGDCASGQFCNGASLTCTAKLANGTTLVTDPLHNGGVCNASVGTAECVSGVCDVDNKCGFANGDGTCNAGNASTVCRSGVCGSDSKCGLVVGDGTCTTGNASTVCRSGACGSTSGECVPAGGAGCVVDGDCGTGRFCNTAANTCLATIANGSPIPTFSGHNPPLTGTCTAAVGAAVCASGVCDATANVCGINSGDGTCTASAQCNAGVCVTSGANSGKCEPCISDATCSGATPACNTTTNQCVTCTAGNISACNGLTPACSANACVACNGDNATSTSAACPTSAQPYCLGTGACGKCASNLDCAGNHPGPICNTSSGACGAQCSVDSDCTSSQWCDNPTAAASSGTCAAKVVNGKPVPASAPINGACTQGVGARVCVSGVCDAGDNLCGEPNSRACASAAVCRSNVCNADGKCGDPNGVTCTSTVTCRSAFCDEDGKCGELNGDPCKDDVDCRSGICQPADAKCGALNGEPCTTVNPLECRGGVCFTDGACGIPTGQSCTTDASCRNGACLSGKCTASCTQDAQCPSGEYCDATAKACAPSAPNGAQPGGSPCTRAAQCLSGECNADGKCGDPDGSACATPITCRGASCVASKCGTALGSGATCSSGAQCASGVCAIDGKCGTPVGAPCATPSQCRSDICDATGTCVTACTVDADCVAGTYCLTGSCAPSAPNGQKPGGVSCNRGAQCLSDVCDADGTCGSVNGIGCGTPLTCRSAVCDPADGKCGLANGDGPCSAGNATTVCRGGACEAADGKCGLANGDGPCANGGQCRSNTCDVSGTQKCVGCAKDSDCPTGEFCSSTTSTCTATLANGAPCTRKVECTSAVCDPDNMCGKIDGEPCGSTVECRSGSCVNGTCGIPDGGAPDAGGDSGAPDAGPDASDASEVDAAPDATVTPSDASAVDATTEAGGPTPEGGGIGGGGCSCRTGATSSSDVPWAGLGAVAACSMLLRRRPRRDPQAR